MCTQVVVKQLPNYSTVGPCLARTRYAGDVEALPLSASKVLQPWVHNVAVGEATDLGIQGLPLRPHHSRQLSVGQAGEEHAFHQGAPIVVLDPTKPLQGNTIAES